MHREAVALWISFSKVRGRSACGPLNLHDASRPQPVGSLAIVQMPAATGSKDSAELCEDSLLSHIHLLYVHQERPGHDRCATLASAATSQG